MISSLEENKKQMRDIDMDELMLGIEYELAHTTKNTGLATELALEKLTGNPRFYSDKAKPVKTQKAPKAKKQQPNRHH